MSNFICTVNGTRGRNLDLYDNKCVIKTDVSLESFMTRNANDGEKIIFFIDCCGLQFKEAGNTIGFLQLETSTPQMNNLDSNYYSENSFTFDNGHKNNRLMRDIYDYIAVRMEGYKYWDDSLLKANLPDSLAEIYGKARPLSTVEEEEKLKEDEAEREEAIVQKKAARNERKDQYERKALDANVINAKKIACFVADSDDLIRFSDILNTWVLYGLADEKEYDDITDELAKKTEIERYYGINPNNISAFITKIKERFQLL